MRVIVVEGPEPIITPADVPGDLAADDARVVALIAAAQAQVDGPTGWLGRALGVQTLEVRSTYWPGSLPYYPAIEIVSVTVDGDPIEGVDVEWDGVLHLPDYLPSGTVVIRYRAGYDGDKTGSVPANAKAALSMMVQGMLMLDAKNGGLRSVTVDDTYTEAFNSPEMVQAGRNAVVDGLLAPLRIWSL